LQQILVFEIAEALAGAGEFRVVVIDDERFHLGGAERLLHHLGKFAVDNKHFAFGVIEGEAENRGVEPRIERVEHGARHRHPVMRLDHGRRVGEHHRDGVAALDAAADKRRGKFARTGIKLPVIPGTLAVDDRGDVRINARGARQKRHRRQRLKIRRIAVEIGVVGARHLLGSPARASLAKKTAMANSEIAANSGLKFAAAHKFEMSVLTAFE
jgi:hypothetical protein